MDGGTIIVRSVIGLYTLLMILTVELAMRMKDLIGYAKNAILS